MCSRCNACEAGVCVCVCVRVCVCVCVSVCVSVCVWCMCYFGSPHAEYTEASVEEPCEVRVLFSKLLASIFAGRGALTGWPDLTERALGWNKSAECNLNVCEPLIPDKTSGWSFFSVRDNPLEMRACTTKREFTQEENNRRAWSVVPVPFDSLNKDMFSEYLEDGKPWLLLSSLEFSLFLVIKFAWLERAEVDPPCWNRFHVCHNFVCLHSKHTAGVRTKLRRQHHLLARMHRPFNRQNLKRFRTKLYL